MKKFLVLAVLFLGICLPVNAKSNVVSDYEYVQDLGFKILKANNIDKRFTFNLTSIGHQGIFPILIDTSYSNDVNLHNNRVVSIYFADYARLNEAELAGIICHEIAQGLHSYRGIMQGQLFATKNGHFPLNFITKHNELNYDRQAVDMMINAGYDPKYLISALEKTTGEWRGTFWGRHNKTSKRVARINKYLSTK